MSLAIIEVAGVKVNQDAEGRYSLNDLHRAAGGEKRHAPNEFLRVGSTKELVKELTGDSRLAPVDSVRGGSNPGTYVVKELVYAYAMWISPAFNLKVIRAYDNPRKLTQAEMTLMVISNLQEEVAQQRLALEQTTAERDQAIKTKAQISSSREASVMGKLSAASRKINKLEGELGFNTRHASIIAVENATGRKFGKQGWRPLKKWCEQRGLSAVSVPCQRWGTAKAWPALAWKDVYSVDLVELFGGV